MSALRVRRGRIGIDNGRGRNTAGVVAVLDGSNCGGRDNGKQPGDVRLVHLRRHE